MDGVFQKWSVYIMDPAKLDVFEIKELRKHSTWALLRRKEHDFVAYSVNMHDMKVSYYTWNVAEFLDVSCIAGCTDKDKGLVEDVACYLIKKFYKGYLQGVANNSRHVGIVLHILYNQVPAIMEFLRKRNEDVSWLFKMIHEVYAVSWNKNGTLLQFGELETLVQRYMYDPGDSTITVL